MRLINKIKNKIESINANIYFRHQRAKKGYCNKDLFEIGTWFLEIMPRMLDEYYKYAHAMSNVLINDYINEHKDEMDKRDDGFLPSEKLTKEEYDSLAKKWDEIIIEMKNCFLNALPKTCDYKNKFEDDFNKTYEEFKKEHPLDKNKVKKDGKIIASIDIPDFNKFHTNIAKLYFHEEKKIDDYMEANRIKGMKLFMKYMNDLID